MRPSPSKGISSLDDIVKMGQLIQANLRLRLMAVPLTYICLRVCGVCMASLIEPSLVNQCCDSVRLY